MSIQSYQRNVAAGVAGPHLPVCLPAALEQISPFGYRPEVYRQHRSFINNFVKLNSWQQRQQHEQYEMAFLELLEPLGGVALEEVTMMRVATVSGLKRAVNRLHADGRRVVVDICYGNVNPEYSTHSVGLIPVEPDYVTLVSTAVPRCLSGVVSLEQVAERLAVSATAPIKGHPFYTSNLLAIPAA